MESLSKWVIEHAIEQGFLVVLLLITVIFLVKMVIQLSEKVDKIQADFFSYIEQDHERTIILLEETKTALVNCNRIMDRIEHKLG